MILGKPPLLQLRLCLQGFDPALAALELPLGAVEEEGDEGRDLGAEGGFGGGEGCLGDELVVLFGWAVSI